MIIPLKQLHGSTRADFAHLFLKTPGCQDFEILLLSRKAETCTSPRGAKSADTWLGAQFDAACRRCYEGGAVGRP